MCLPPYGYKKDPDDPRKWIIDDEAAEVVRRIYRLCVEGNGVETTARMLQEDGILTPTQYWAAKGIRKGGKKSQDTPCKGGRLPGFFEDYGIPDTLPVRQPNHVYQQQRYTGYYVRFGRCGYDEVQPI